jgi:hypothetical protein
MTNIDADEIALELIVISIPIYLPKARKVITEKGQTLNRIEDTFHNMIERNSHIGNVSAILKL